MTKLEKAKELYIERESMVNHKLKARRALLRVDDRIKETCTAAQIAIIMECLDDAYKLGLYEADL